MKNVYLLEIDKLQIGGASDFAGKDKGFIPMDKLEPIGVFASEKDARAAIPSEATEALITKLPIGRVYVRGIGEAIHKHIGGTTY
jgi:hypothetical protein